MNKTYTFIGGDMPIVATAIHDGHKVRPELEPLFALSEEQRLREEDPFTSYWVGCSNNQVVVEHSRFETDVNRPRDKAVYQRPEDAWGLHVWKASLRADVLKRSLKIYDAFYADLRAYFDELFTHHPRLIVYDIHSYNHRRASKDINDNEAENPEINIGTKNVNASVWRPVIDAIMNSFRSFDYAGRSLDTRENIKFRGGYFGEWLYAQYGDNICPVSIEFKKFFMDEWTGRPFEKDILLISQLLQQSVEPVLESLQTVTT